MDPRLNLNNGTHLWIADHLDYQGDDCVRWPYTGVRGYGQLKFDGKIRKANRVMCELAHGPAPGPGYEAAHSCGKGHLGCMNPKHLSWKTRTENQRDRRIHGTAGNGGYGRRPRLTPDQVLAIRASTDTIADLSRRYRVTTRAISMIRNREIWKEIHGTPERARVIEALQAANGPMHYADLPGKSSLIHTMTKRGMIVRAARGLYRLPELTPETKK